MNNEILDDDEFWNQRWSFVSCCMFDHIVFLLEKKHKRPLPPDISATVKMYRKFRSDVEEDYLNYKKWIFSKFGKSGVETVLAIAFNFAMKNSEAIANLTNISPKDTASAIDAKCADVCVSLAKWEYEAGHFKCVRWTAYVAAGALIAAGALSIIDLCRQWFF